MRTSLLLLTTSLSAFAFGQCDFDPVVTPTDIILCPGETVTLEVGEYDSYQWFQDDQPLSQGATLTVDHFNSGSMYFVEVTLDGCTEASPAVLVDGWAFLPPFVIHGGDEPIAVGPMGELTFCEGQTVELEMSSTYSESITWTNNGVIIPNENDPVLVVTETGSYSASGAPSVCPNYVQPLGVIIDIQFVEPQQPSIMENDGELCAFPIGQSYTWYLNGEELDGENGACIAQSGAGAYTVFVEYGQDCEVISEPHLITNVNEAHADRPWIMYPNPTKGQMSIAMDASLSSGAFYTVFDALGQEVASGWMPLNGLLQLDLGLLESGTYLFQAAKDGKALAPASRFTIVK